jgi:hypothetical protein
VLALPHHHCKTKANATTVKAKAPAEPLHRIHNNSCWLTVQLPVLVVQLHASFLTRHLARHLTVNLRHVIIAAQVAAIVPVPAAGAPAAAATVTSFWVHAGTKNTPAETQDQGNKNTTFLPCAGLDNA